TSQPFIPSAAKRSRGTALDRGRMPTEITVQNVGTMGLACLLSALVVAAERDAPTTGRTVGHHTFPFPVLQEPAFVTTNVSLRHGGGYVRAGNLPLGDAGSVTVTSAGLEETLELGIAFTEQVG